MKPEVRYEIKFEVPLQEQDKIFEWLALSNGHFLRSYPSRQVNNIYFDTYNGESAFESVSGNSQRFKVRVRWYGPLNPPEGPLRFEIKAKHGTLVKKEIVILKKALDFSKTWTGIVEEVYRQLPLEFKPSLCQYNQVSLINSYFRDYFVSQNQKVRLTVDRDLKFYNQRHARALDTRSKVENELLICELKYHPQDAKDFLQIVRGIPFPRTRYSKYVQGSLCT